MYLLPREQLSPERTQTTPTPQASGNKRLGCKAGQGQMEGIHVALWERTDPSQVWKNNYQDTWKWGSMRRGVRMCPKKVQTMIWAVAAGVPEPRSVREECRSQEGAGCSETASRRSKRLREHWLERRMRPVPTLVKWEEMRPNIYVKR